MKSNENVMNAWVDVMNGMMDTWKQTLSKWSEEQEDTAESVNNFAQTWTNTYTKMMDSFWLPFSSNEQQNRKAKEESTSAFAPFNFTPYSLMPFMNQISWMYNLMNDYNSVLYSTRDKVSDITHTMIHMYDQMLFSYSNMSKVFPHLGSSWYAEARHNLMRSFLPFGFHNRVKNPDWTAPMYFTEYYNRFVNKAARIQFLIGKASVAAWEKTVKKLSEEKDKTFNPEDFYKVLSEANEVEFVNLFHTKEYVMLQEDLIKIQSELVKIYEKQTELMFQPLPFMLKSQMDEIYQSNHDLRKRMNKIEQPVSQN